MKSKIFKMFAMLVLMPVLLSAQDYKFGKVSVDELKETQHPNEQDAPAAYLYSYRETYFTWAGDNIQLITQVHERIKIYNKNGLDFAKNEIILADNSNGTEIVSGLKAYTYNLDGENVVEAKLSKENIFDEKINKYRKKKTFTLPNVKEGSVIEYEYKINSPFYFSIDEFSFQSSIPIKKLEAIFRAPKYFVFKPTYKGYMPIRPKVETKMDARMGEDVVITSYNFSNVPSMKDEVYVDNIKNYRSGISYELQTINIPGRYFKSYTRSWDDVTKSIYDYPDFGDELKKTGYFETDIDPLISSTSNRDERIKVIFDFVKKKMNWNSYYAVGCDKGVKTAYKENTGNVAEINLMLTAMLRHAQINANPVLVSTKSHGIPLFPTSDGFNYVICAVEIPDGLILLDATDKNATLNVLPTRAINWMGRLIRKEGSSAEVNLLPNTNAKEVVNANISLNEDASLEGKIRHQYTDHMALSHRTNYGSMDQNEYIEKLENRFDGIEIEEYSIDNMNDANKPIVETFNFSKDTGAEIIGGKIYISPLMFFSMRENPFKLDKRDFPIDFIYPTSARYLINIQIPEGYKVESQPENLAMVLPDELGKFVFNMKSQGNTLQVVVTSEINTGIVPATYYDSIKNYFGQIVQKETEKVVLTKI